MEEGVAIKCPNCNDNASYDAAAGLAVCGRCGHAFEPSDIDAEGQLSVGVQPDTPEHTVAVSQAKERTPWKRPLKTYTSIRACTCPSCGARFLTHGSISTASCPFCVNDHLVPDTKSEDLVPSHVLPFSVSKSHAKEILEEHVATVDKAYLPRDFAPDLEHVQGVYVPYFLFDLVVEGEVGAACTRTMRRGRGSATYHYAASAGGVGQFEQVPTGASSHMPDGHMDAIAPFDLSLIESLSPEHLAGFLAEVPDKDEARLRRRAENLAWGSMLAQGPDAIHTRYPKLTSVGPAIGRWSKVQTEHATLCYLPVWLLHCRWRDEELLFAVNGQTGECVGNMPVDELKRGWALRKSILPLVIAFAIFLLIIYCIMQTHAQYVLSHNTPFDEPDYTALIFRSMLILLIAGLVLFKKMDASARHEDEVRIQQVRSARKAESSMENQARQDVSIRNFRIRLVPGELEADAVAAACQGQPDPRYAQMASFARDACSAYARAVEESERPIDVPEDNFVPPPAIPLDDDVVALHIERWPSAHPWGYAITSRGLYCHQRSESPKADWNRVDWLEFARGHDLTIVGDKIVQDGKMLAYGIHETQRSRLCNLYLQLWIEARRVYDVSAMEQLEESKRSAKQRQAQMVTGTRRACTNFLMKVGSECLAQSDNARTVLSIPSGAAVRIVHTNGAQGHPNSGFAISDVGVFCREANEAKARHMDWRSIASMPEPRLDGTCVRAGDDSLACYEGDDAVREELLALFRELWLLAV